jgi:hypothetical protein
MKSERLVQSLKSFAQTEREIVEFGRVGDASKALDLVRLRKQLIAEFATLGTALETEPDLAQDANAKTEILRLFSAFRAANSINTAEWPVIRVRDHLTEYRSAVQNVGQAAQAFWHRIKLISD